ncbi:MAG: DUF3616 domain-containing protein, partial [Polymorphobacter sp.]
MAARRSPGLVLAALLFAGSAAAAPRLSSYYGLCDASAVVFAGGRMIVAGDELDPVSHRNVLHAFVPGNPRGTGIELTGIFGSRQIEADIEAGATMGSRQFWIGGHGASQAGKPRPGQQLLFATRIAGNNLVAVQGVSRTLLADLSADRRYAALGIGAATRRAPEAGNGFNIEGLAAVGSTLLIGLRGPLVDG